MLQRQGSHISETHPPAIQRWNRIKKGLHDAGVERDLVSDVDDAYDTILGWFKLAPARSRA